MRVRLFPVDEGDSPVRGLFKPAGEFQRRRAAPADQIPDIAFRQRQIMCKTRPGASSRLVDIALERIVHGF